MNSKELRVGNLIQISRYIKSNEPTVIMTYPIEQIGKDENEGYYYVVVDGGFCCNIETGIRPIPLTEDCLLRFGFDNINGMQWVKNGIRVNMAGSKPMIFWEDEFGDTQRLILKSNHLHTLQNAWHVITGEELIYTQNGQ